MGLLAQKPFIVPIPGTRNMQHLQENLGAINIELSLPEILELETAADKIKIHGGRMSEMHMQAVDKYKCPYFHKYKNYR